MKGAADTDFEAAPTYADSKSKQEGANADVTLAQYIEPDLHVLKKVIRKVRPFGENISRTADSIRLTTGSCRPCPFSTCSHTWTEVL